MIGSLVPADVGWAERFDDDVPAELFPEEEAVVARSVAKRRREFVTGRWCARQALAQLGFPRLPVPSGERGAPAWPDGVVGAITHCAGYRAAVVARRKTTVALGVDAEPHAVLPEGVLDAVSLPAERDHLAGLAARLPATCWDRLLFSAKEAVYKAWFPLTRRPLDFSEARVSFGADGTFSAEILVDAPVVPGHGRLAGFSGRWATGRGLVLTAIVLSAPR